MSSAVKRKTVCELLNNVVFSEERNIFNSPISDGELDEALDCLKTDKSKGADNIYYEFLKRLAPDARKVLVKFSTSYGKKGVFHMGKGCPFSVV
ncbi:hypothetical protein CEXT_631511 [Caerostris extrusa]|uniref:Uncharacterized protein n=1 Tax=Caerostris extrusa TaxID=172846 RepID=A0AAV4RSL9_CAEEX|nr:hypothetical protein CEXT_631511 [Caerostris extrusa]